MEECKWIMVRRESTFDKIKKFFKCHFFKWTVKRKNEQIKENKPTKKKGEIIIEIVK